MAHESIRINDWYDESAGIADMRQRAGIEGAKAYRILSEAAPALSRISLEDGFYGTSNDAVGQLRRRAMAELRNSAYVVWEAYTNTYEAAADEAEDTA